MAVLNVGNTGEIINVGSQLDDQELKQLDALVAKHAEAYSIAGELGSTDLIEHIIELIQGAKPIVEPMRRRPRPHAIETAKQVKNMLDQGVIEPSTSAWDSEYVLVRKELGEWRLCVDHRKLNAVTKKCMFPLPNFATCLESVAGKKYFSRIAAAH